MRWFITLIFVAFATQAIAQQMTTDEMLRVLQNRRVCKSATQKSCTPTVNTAPAAAPVVAVTVQPQQKTVAQTVIIPRESVSKGTGSGQVFITRKSDDQLQPKTKPGFNELSVYAGWWRNPKGADGIWAMGEFLRWNRTDGPTNYGYGIISQLDYGWGKNKSHWGYASVGPVLSLYTELGMADSFQVKLRPQYRFNEHPKADGWMPGAYLEFDHVLGRNDKMFLTADGHYFKNDSFIGLNAYWEHRFNRTVKAKAGFGVNWNFSGGGTTFGFGPSLSVKLYDRFTIGWSANFFDGGPLYGLYVGYELNTDIMAMDASIRENSVSLKQPAVEPVQHINSTPNSLPIIDKGEK